MSVSPASTGAGYSPKPLAAKLGIRPGQRVSLVGAPSEYHRLLDPAPAGVEFDSAPGPDSDLVHVFVDSRAVLSAALTELRHGLRAETPVWVSWPKRASGVATDVTEDVIRHVALPLGFVDVKVCAVSEIWSGLKLVVRTHLR